MFSQLRGANDGVWGAMCGAGEVKPISTLIIPISMCYYSKLHNTITI